MAKFRFRLQVVLDHRKRIEDLQKIALMEIHNRLLQNREIQNRLAHEHEKFSRRLRENHSMLDKDELYRSYLHIDYLSRTIRSYEEKIEEIMQEILAARRRLTKASQDRLILERLCEQRRSAFEQNRARRELAELDDRNSRLANGFRQAFGGTIS